MNRTMRQQTRFSARRMLFAALLAGGVITTGTTVHAQPSETNAAAKMPMQMAKVTYVDTTRSVKAVNGFAGSDTRRIDVTIWSPPADVPIPEGGWPMVIYSHGSFGAADNAMGLVQTLVNNGYIVVAPDYPLSSRAAYTKITAIDITDVNNQTKDIHFILDQLLSDPMWSGKINPNKIASMGHSLGAVTSYFTSFGSMAFDKRIKATVLTGAGDPVQAALAADMGMVGNWNMPSRVPVLFLSGEHDAFALINGGHHTAYSRVSGPKYEIMVKGGVHIWFRDSQPQAAGGQNPDCALLAMFNPGYTLAGCEEGVWITSPKRQEEIMFVSVIDFLDGYLKNDAAKLNHLRALPNEMPDIEFRYQD